MKNYKKIILLGAVILAIGATSFTVFAASEYKTPAQAVAELTGKTLENVVEERQETSKTYGAMAKDAGKLDEFKKENIEIKKDNLQVQVSEGKITQEKADTIITEIEKRQANCDGTGSESMDKHKGKRGSHGFGLANGQRGHHGRKGAMRLENGPCQLPAE